jgi:hypothetical protein
VSEHLPEKLPRRAGARHYGGVGVHADLPRKRKGRAVSERPWEWQQLPDLTSGRRGDTGGKGVHGEARMSDRLKAPWPAFGGKSRVAALVWARLGNPDNYCEPFCHSAAVLLARPHPPRIETLNDPAGDVTNAWRALHPEGGDQGAVATELLNDLDPYIANVWRSIQAEPEETARWADSPVHELDLHAFHRWLVLGEDAAVFRERLRADPDYYCPRRAGRWLAGACMWIGRGFCSTMDGQKGRTHGESPRPAGLTKASGDGVHGDHLSQQVPRAIGGKNGAPGDAGCPRSSEQLPDLSSGSVDVHAAGGPVHRSRRPVIGHGGERGVHADLPQGRPQLADAYSRGRGVHDDNHLSQQRPSISANQCGDAGQGVHLIPRDGTLGTCDQRRAWLVAWFSRLRDRLRTVRVVCGHWLRVCDSESVTTRLGTTGLMLDPPYALSLKRLAAWKVHLRGEGPEPSRKREGGNRDGGLYATDGADVDRLVAEVHAYCLERGGNPKMRMALCGYEGEHNELEERGWEKVCWAASGGYGNRTAKGKANSRRERIWFSPHCLKALEPGLFDTTIDEGGVP